MEDLSLKGIPPKCSQSWGIANLVAQPQELGLHKKLPNWRAFHEILGARSPRKEAHQPRVLLPTQIPQRNTSKTFPQKSTKKGSENHRKIKTRSTRKYKGAQG
jgi:hypothetical protein